MSRVGIVSSFLLPVTLFTKLTTPLSAHTITQKDAGGDYDAKSRRKMKQAVKDLLNVPAPSRPELVIAVGGLVAATAVSNYIAVNDDIPFLVCIGRVPNDGSSLLDNDQFMGGINLDTPSQNSIRAAYLIQKTA